MASPAASIGRNFPLVWRITRSERASPADFLIVATSDFDTVLSTVTTTLPLAVSVYHEMPSTPEARTPCLAAARRVSAVAWLAGCVPDGVADVAGDWSSAVAAARPTTAKPAWMMVRGRCEMLATVPPENVSTGNRFLRTSHRPARP